MKKLINKIIDLTKKYDKLFKYVIAGCCTTLFNLGLFFFLIKVCNIDVTFSNIISVVFSVLFAYAVNRTFVFKSDVKKFSKILAEFSKFISGRLFTMIIEVGGVYLLVNVLRQDEILSKAATQMIVFILNYLVSKTIVFKCVKKAPKKDVI